MTDESAISAAIVMLLSERAQERSICPSEVARALQADESEWRQLMPQVRQMAAALIEARMIEATQGERRLPSSDVLMAEGPIRLRRGEMFPLER